jgi:hypothetical protein
VPDIEPTEGSGDADSGGWLASLFNSTPKVIGAISGLIVAVSGLLIALNKAGLVGGDSTDSNTTLANTTTATTTTTTPPGVFSEFDRRNGKLSYSEDGTMKIQAKQPRSPVVALSNQETPLDVEMSTQVKWKGGAYDYGVSLICRRQNPKNYYLLGVLPDKRRYSIARYRDGRLVLLRRGINGLVDDKENKLKATCLNDRPTILKLEVNEQEIARASDPEGLGAGDVGIRVGTNERSEVTVAFVGFRAGAPS